MALVQNGYVIMRLSLIKNYIAIYWDETGESSISIALFMMCMVMFIFLYVLMIEYK